VQNGRNGAIIAQVHATKSRCNFSQRTNQIDLIGPKLMFRGVSGCFIAARPLVQNGLNLCHLCTSSCNEVASEFLITNAPDPPHWTPNSCFGEFLTVSLLQSTGAINAQVHATKSHRNFSQRTHLNHPITPQTHLWRVSNCFVTK
jgi:hypothetical protein